MGRLKQALIDTEHEQVWEREQAQEESGMRDQVPRVEVTVKVVGITFAGGDGSNQKSPTVDINTSHAFYKPEPENKYDPEALAVYAGNTRAGYVGKDDPNRDELAKLSGRPQKILRINALEEGEKGLYKGQEPGTLTQLWLQSSVPKQKQGGATKEALGGEVVVFDEAAHTYTIKGTTTKLKSVSGFYGTFEQDFPMAAVAQRTAKSKGMEVEKVLDAWDLKREGASNLGNYVHLVMEAYIKHGSMGIFKDPLSQAVVKSYVDAFGEPAGDLMTEKIVTLDGICGTMDLYDVDNRTVIDFKSNPHQFSKKQKFEEPLASLVQPTKLGAYTAQLNIYTDMAEEITGKTHAPPVIQSLDISRMEWKSITLPRVKVFRPLMGAMVK